MDPLPHPVPDVAAAAVRGKNGDNNPANEDGSGANESGDTSGDGREPKKVKGL